MIFTELKVVIMNNLKFVFLSKKHAIENTKYMDRTRKSHSSFIFLSFIFIWALPAAGLSAHTPAGLNHRLVSAPIPNAKLPVTAGDAILRFFAGWICIKEREVLQTHYY